MGKRTGVGIVSILIRGMEMPKNCIDCAFGWNGWCHRINSRAFVEVDMRRHDCPLVELPKHGRLIDAGALEDSLPVNYPSVLFAIHDAPTVIPAEGAEE